jgi:NAD(P)-dependent dehydrogenase (short-subunit alcohol dehydrogenase family)|tara:strand:- start:1100 stop:1966 length:867 start_codon:yes stop_codon:yes gene_type:complete
MLLYNSDIVFKHQIKLLKEQKMKINTLFNVEGKVAVVTGGSRGIGEMIAAGFLANGAKVYITARKEIELHTKAKELVEEFGGECISIASNLDSNEGIEAFVKEISDREDHVDFLINNAGASWGEDFDTFPEMGWDKVMNLNVKSIFFMSQKFKPLLTANNSAEDPSRIVNIGSIDGLNVPDVDTYSYSASKAAVHQLTRHLAKRLVKDNINVNAIAPGPFESQMLGALLNHDYTEVAKSNPKGRVGSAEDIAGLTIFLCSRASAYTIGETITCDGGVGKLAGHGGQIA